jgi:endonuclease YncB( thermonuclease family)
MIHTRLILKARCYKVVDGDTLDVIWSDDPPHPHLPFRIRIAGIDAPELYPWAHPGAAAAKARLSALCLGNLITVIITRKHPDLYGRQIARLLCPQGDVAEILVKEGFVTAYNARLRRLARNKIIGPRPSSQIPHSTQSVPPGTTTPPANISNETAAGSSGSRSIRPSNR